MVTKILRKKEKKDLTGPTLLEITDYPTYRGPCKQMVTTLYGFAEGKRLAWNLTVGGPQKKRFQLSFSNDTLQFSEGRKWYQNYKRDKAQREEFN